MKTAVRRSYILLVDRFVHALSAPWYITASARQIRDRRKLLVWSKAIVANSVEAADAERPNGFIHFSRNLRAVSFITSSRLQFARWTQTFNIHSLLTAANCSVQQRPTEREKLTK